MSYTSTLPLSVGLALTLAGAAHAQGLTNTGQLLTVRPGAVLAVPGALVNQAGGTLALSGTTLVGGNFLNAGTLGPSSGTLVLMGAADQTLRAGGATLAALEVRNTGHAGQNRVLLPADLTLTQRLSLTSGLLRTAPGATLHLADGAQLLGEASGRYVQGNLEVVRANVQGTNPLDFGNGVALNPGGNTLGTIHVTRTAGLQTAGLSYGVNPANNTQQGIDRVWTIAADQAPTAPVALTFSWLPDDDNGLTDFSQAQVWRLPDNASAWLPVGARANAVARSITTSTSTFSRWTVSNAQNPLPVTLAAFMAQPQGTDARLRWITASELRNDRFEVESSVDGQTFQRLGQVAGHGTTTLASSYEWLDRNLARYAAPLVYYRLRQVDANGTATYSPVRTVQVAQLPAFAAQVYPTSSGPADVLTLLVQTRQAGPVTWELRDAVGRLVASDSQEVPLGASTWPLPQLHELATGVYLLRVHQGASQQSLKLIRR